MAAGVRKHIVRDERGGFRIFHRPDMRRSGQLFTFCGLALTPGVIGFAYLESHGVYVALAIIGVFGAVSALVGMGYWVVYRHSSFINTNTRVIERPFTPPIAFDSVAAVHLDTQIEWVPARHGKRPIQRYVGSVITDAADPKLAVKIMEAMTALIESDTEDTDRVDALLDRLAGEHARMAGVSTELVNHPAVLEIWRVGEFLARTLKVPMLDFCSGALEERTVPELDLPLHERLRRRASRLERPGTPPEGIRLLESSSALFAATWKPGFFSGAKTLTVDRGSATLGKRVLPLAEIETVRAETVLKNMVLIIGDTEAIRCRLATSEQASWLSAAVRYFLAGS